MKHSYLTPLLRPLFGQYEYSVKKLFRICGYLENIEIVAGRCIGNFDVVDLFTKVPIRDTLLLLEKTLLPRHIGPVLPYTYIYLFSL